MGDVYPMGFNIPMEEKHRVVRAYYEEAYDCKLKEKLLDADVQKLWMKISKLQDEMGSHFKNKPGAKKAFYKSLGITDPSLEA